MMAPRTFPPRQTMATARLRKFFTHLSLCVLLGITKLGKEKNQRIRQKTRAQNTVKEIKTVPEKVATTCTEDGHKRTTKTSTTI